jgi:hypothetical protein
MDDEAVLRGLALVELVRKLGGAGSRQDYMALSSELNVAEAMRVSLYLACMVVQIAERVNFPLDQAIEHERRGALGLGA